MTDEPICFPSQENHLCSYILVGNRMHDKSLGMARGLATAQSLGNTKFANAPPLRLTRPANALQLPGGGG